MAKKEIPYYLTILFYAFCCGDESLTRRENGKRQVASTLRNIPTMFQQPFHRRAKTAPSHYPRVPFHLLRFCQLLASLIVGGIMSFFMWHLTHDHWQTPWTFILVCPTLQLTTDCAAY